jgi:hypothetical protein
LLLGVTGVLAVATTPAVGRAGAPLPAAELVLTGGLEDPDVPEAAEDGAAEDAGSLGLEHATAAGMTRASVRVRWRIGFSSISAG